MRSLEKRELAWLFQVKIQNDDLCDGALLSYAQITFMHQFLKEFYTGETLASLCIAGIIPISLGSYYLPSGDHG